MSEPKKTERLGVSTLDHYFSSHGWLFREQLHHDYGIDAQVEIVKANRPTGNLIAIQVKSGESYFSESTKTSFVYRPDSKHIEYWLKHSLPVIVVLYDPKSNALFWENVSEKTITKTKQGWKIDIPRVKVLNAQSLHELHELTQPPPYVQKLNKLRLDKAWIDLVAQGEVVYIEFDDWVNKSLPRFSIRIGCDSRDDLEEKTWPTVYGPGLSIDEMISNAIPWADYEIDEDAYRQHMESIWSAECYQGRDEDTGEPYFSQPFSDWYEPPEGFVPVSSDGEIETYRLILSLNKLGDAFLILDEYLTEEDDFENRTFTLDL